MSEPTIDYEHERLMREIRDAQGMCRRPRLAV